MPLFKSQVHEDVWLSHWCERCWRTDKDGRTTCPILNVALTRGRKPPQWTRNPRAQVMADTYKCSEFSTKPPKRKREQLFDDVPMFDVEMKDVGFVPVEGWPDDPKKKGEVDHA